MRKSTSPLERTIQPSGVNVTSAVSSVTYFPSVGWGALTWGSQEWGEFESPVAAVTGISIGTFAIGTESVTANANIIPTGASMTSAVGDEVAGTSAEAPVTGQSMTSSRGTVFAGELVTVEVTSPSNDPWGNDTWGNSLWGNGDGNTLLTGVEIIIPSVDVISTGQSLTTNVSSVSVTADANTGALTGLSTTFSLGTAVLDANTIASPSGISLTPLSIKCLGLQQNGVQVGLLNTRYLPVYPLLNQKAIRGAD